MNVESGFLPKGNNPVAAIETASFTGFQTLSTSETGFFRILVGKHLGRRVVIKTLKDDFKNNPVAITQLKKEFSIIFPVVSPNVVHAYCMMNIEGNVPAIELEWCDGKDVRQLLDDKMNLEEAADIIRGVLGGLRDIHQRGIVHRDIKPENVMYDPFRKVVKIIDFGCAYITGATALQGPNGTLGYTPEDKIIAGSEAEPKDDLYALGVMVAEIAENVSVGSKNEISIRRRLKLFSDKLISGRFEKAEDAAEAFEKILHGKKNLQFPFIASVAVIFIVGLFFFLLPLKNTASQRESYIVENKTDTLAISETTPLVEKDDIQKASDDFPRTGAEQKSIDSQVDRPADKSGQEPSGEYLNPYTGISAEDEAAYEMAIYAGKLMETAESKNASQGIRMDAFVVKFCDSVYMAENFFDKYPRYMEVEEMRELAKKLASKYSGKMEKEFRKSFGDAGDIHRRKVMLEGRFYGSLKSYNHNPYYKTPDSEKSN